MAKVNKIRLRNGLGGDPLPHGGRVSVGVPLKLTVEGDADTNGTGSNHSRFRFLMSVSYRVKGVKVHHPKTLVLESDDQNGVPAFKSVGERKFTPTRRGRLMIRVFAWDKTNDPSKAGAVVAATNTSPIEIETKFNHGLANGDVVVISGVEGNTAANGTWTIAVTALKKFTLTGSQFNGIYAGAGGYVKKNTAVAPSFATMKKKVFTYKVVG